MATLVLSAAGAAFGGGLGGSFLGITGAAAGKAVGATLGSLVDRKLFGEGSAPVESGRVDRLRIMGSGEGAPLPRVFGRMRVAGLLIWSSRFLESVSTQSVGGKGGRRGQEVRQYGYSVSIAVALCEGEVLRIGRIWADGQPISQSGLTIRLHAGSEDQLPDPLIAAIEGEDRAPAYRGTAYVVIEDLDLGPFGNRIPQLNFEVFRRPRAGGAAARPPADEVRAVALVPGTGEYALATVPVAVERERGAASFANVNNDRGVPDLVASLDQLDAELPNCGAVSLVVSWFADDLRIGTCALYPAVEPGSLDGDTMAWSVAGVPRGVARRVSELDGRPVFGGTPSDESVVQAIRHLAAGGKAVMFYPFILMDILPGNGLEDPWSPPAEQPPVPWRGRMTLSRAPGTAGSPDGTAAAAAEVAAFFGSAAASDFAIVGDRVAYTGPSEWSYRRFILHYAHLCAAAGGVDAFCIGSEMRSLTQIRDGRTSYPAVAALVQLAAEVRAILGPAVRIGYAADWSEYFGHRPDDGSGDVLFHLDPLWAHPDVDFVGIDNYMPLSDWRDAPDHLDAGAGSIYDIAYLRGNVAGGEGYDWYYRDRAARDAQQRSPIEDTAHAEHWVFRYKDLHGWWSNPHRNRIGGVREAGPTPWVPRSKPIWFTELGCPAVEKGTNQPNVFFDPKSSESMLPYYSSGAPDDFVQARYLQAVHAYWSDAGANPHSPVYGGPMVDMDRAFVWAWDARPWPDFPARIDTWVDGTNHALGHWLNGRIGSPLVADVIAEICLAAGVQDCEVSRVHGSLRGSIISGVESGRQSLQPLQIAYGVDFRAEAGRLVASTAAGRTAATVATDRLAVTGGSAEVERTRASDADTIGRISVSYVRADDDYQAGVVEVRAAERTHLGSSESVVPIVLTPPEAEAVAAALLGRGRAGRETISYALPPSSLALTVGDIVALDAEDAAEAWRIDRITDAATRTVIASRLPPATTSRVAANPPAPALRLVTKAAPVHLEFLDLPLIAEDAVPHAPYAAVLRQPWRGPVALYASSLDAGYRLNTLIDAPATIGTLVDGLPAAGPGLWMEWGGRVRLDSGALSSVSEAEVFAGANAAAVRHGPEADWEVLQFRTAELVGPRTYRLGKLLRGQAGTFGLVPAVWPAGADFVLLDARVAQVELPAAARGLARHYRYGPAEVGYDHASYRHRIAAFRGIGLRPHPPAHLRAEASPDGGITLRWIRCTRVGGDSWQGADVPLGEEALVFAVRVLAGGAPVRETTVSTETWVYSGAQRATDGNPQALAFEVAQVSAQFGPGLPVRIELAA